MRWKCTCSYDGTPFYGWQSQSGQESVQQVLQDALASVFKTRVTIHGSGRTDAGVHALEQVFHFDFDWKHGGDKLVKALYPKLPKSIRVESATAVSDAFHSRFSATGKRYHYRLFLGQADPFRWPFCWSIPERADLNRMAEGLALYQGEHDFAAFAANRGHDYESTVRDIRSVELYQESEFVYLRFEANGFMYKMVRSLVGTLLNVGMGRMKAEEIGQLLESKTRSPMVQTAPARGLYLEKVFY